MPDDRPMSEDFARPNAKRPTEDFTGAPLTDRGPVMQTASGRPFYLLDPQPEDVSLFDIAAHLARINRFNGATREPYSVAQHSVLVSELVPPSLALIGLLHDASETYTGDISRPMKRALEWVGYRGGAVDLVHCIVNPIEMAIWRHFGIDPAVVRAAHDEIKRADNIACATERRDLLAPSRFDWGPMEKPDARTIRTWHPMTAESVFLQRFDMLAPHLYSSEEQRRDRSGR